MYFLEVIISVLTKAVLEGDEDGFLQSKDLQWEPWFLAIGDIFMDDNKFVLMVMMLSTGMMKVMVICDLVQSRQNVRHLVEHVACALDC